MSLYKCRCMTELDLEMVMHWRMQEDVTKYMYTDPILTIENQKKWFHKISNESNFYQWIIEVDNIPCGVISIINIDTKNKHCSWGYYIAQKKYRSFNLALSLELSLYDYVFEILKLNKIYSEAFLVNTPAIKMHELCGCEKEGILKQHIFKNGNYYDICIQSMILDKWKQFKKLCYSYNKIIFD